MDTKQFSVGTKVCRIGEPGFHGEVVGDRLREQSKVAVEWEDGEVEAIYTDDLLVFDPEIEKEWKAAAEKIGKMIKQAEQLLKEAHTIAKNQKISVPELADTHDIDLYGLRSQITKMGWSSSSWNC